jgi:hypothetical protein
MRAHPGEDVAFAPTVVSTRQSVPTDDVAIPLTKKGASKPAKKKRARAEGGASLQDDSKVTPAASALTDDDLRVLPKSRWVWWLLALVGVSLGAWFGWPGGSRLRAMLSPTPAELTPAPTASSAAPLPSVAPSASAPTVAPPTSDAASDARVSSTSPTHVAGSAPLTGRPTPSGAASVAVSAGPTVAPPASTEAPPEDPY